MKSMMFAGVGIVVAYLLLGFMSLVPQRNSLDANTGKVWNALTTGAEKIETLQGQVEAFDENTQQIIDNLAAARNDILAAEQTGDMEAALAAYDEANVQLDALQEAYPDDLSSQPLYITLMDETSGAFNRVSYARDELINSQASFNTACTFFFPVCMMTGGRVDVLGSDSDPAASMDVRPMGDQ